MEFVDGVDIEDFLTASPENINELFLQAIEGFLYLEGNNILHRDIRPQNLLVTTDGILKIIDLGFAKQIEASKDFDKSISLNLWCEKPKEFENGKYDFCTEVYFVGKLFESIIQEVQIESFNYLALLKRMCHRDPEHRLQTFFDVNKEIQSNKFLEIAFDDSEKKRYREFAAAMSKHITKILDEAKYRDDLPTIQKELEDVYRSFMLEETVSDSYLIIKCFIRGTYYRRTEGFPVDAVKNFIVLLKTATSEQKRIILANLHTRFDAIERYSNPPALPDDDDIPF